MAIESIDPRNYFKDVTTELDKNKYDFNGDGTVDIEDYQYARLILNDDKPDNDVEVGFDLSELDTVFAGLKVADEAVNNYDNITANNANKRAEDILAQMQSSQLNPRKAKTLNELQVIGAALTKCIKEAADVSQILADQISTLEPELQTLAKKIKDNEVVYKEATTKAQAKGDVLNAKMNRVVYDSETMTHEYEQKYETVVKNSIDDYMNGEFVGQSLQEVIMINLGQVAGLNTAKIKNEIDSMTSIGLEIKGICQDIEVIVADMREVTSEYNTKNTLNTTCVNNRSNVISAANLANTRYQSGYTVRQEMRNEIIKKYSVKATGSDKYSIENKQVQKLGEFLNNKELDNMPYADAWAVLTEAFDGCGIGYDKNTYQISVPYGHGGKDANGISAQSIFAELVDALKRNYGVEPKIIGYEDPKGPKDPVKNPDRTDPMSFNIGTTRYDFIADKNNNGTFDDVTEFLGAEKGWEEMVAYDEDGNGVISGDELDKLQLLAQDTETGAYSFSTAKEAGIESIDLKSYQDKNEELNNGNLLDGTFSLKVNGQDVNAVQTMDTSRNLDNTFGVLIGSSIIDDEKMYETNPFIEFKEDFNRKAAEDLATTGVSTVGNVSLTKLDSTHKSVDEKINKDVESAKERKKTKEANEKQAAEEEKAAEEKAAEEKAAEDNNKKKLI